MSEQWENDDEVTTTYGSIQLSLRQAYSAGTITERKRIVELLRDPNLVWGADFDGIRYALPKHLPYNHD